MAAKSPLWTPISAHLEAFGIFSKTERLRNKPGEIRCSIPGINIYSIARTYLFRIPRTPPSAAMKHQRYRSMKSGEMPRCEIVNAGYLPTTYHRFSKQLNVGGLFFKPSHVAFNLLILMVGGRGLEPRTSCL
jgi:hypothetical protein